MAKHYHFIGIGGIGMGTLASLLLAKGCGVTGSDVKENELTQLLRRQGARIMIGHDVANLQNPDCVVYSSAIRMTNPEMIEAFSRKIPVLQRAQLLAELVNTQTGITIAGAHGKTTTTSMISYMLINAGLKPTTAVGGIINGATYNALLGSGKYFVAEVDESDGTFLYFHPTYSVITNIDYEHVDYYKNWDNILAAYRKFIGLTQKGGCVIACGEDQRLRQLVAQERAEAVLYGFSPDLDFYATNVSVGGYHSSFECHVQRGTIGTIELQVPGRHNVLNAMACTALGLKLGINFEVIQRTLKSFNGVKRRLQLKGQIDDIMVIDDYGHHPSEIVATLNAVRSFNRKRIVTVFQPHRYSRTKFLFNEFVDSLPLTDYLILTDIYAASEKLIEGVSIQELFDKIRERMGPNVIYLPKDKIMPHLLDVVRSGDVVLTLGAGDVTQLSDQFVAEYQKKCLVNPVISTQS